MKFKRNFIVLLLCIVILTLTGCQNKEAQYPVKDIEVIIPFNVGGGIDVSARTLFTKMDEKFDNIKFVPKNVTGASGTIGAKELYHSANDGYTIMAAGNGLNVAHVMNGFELTYDDYQLVGQYVTSQLGLYVRADSPYQTYDDLIKAAKDSPGKLKMGVLMGTINHYGVLAMEEHSGVKFQHIVVGGEQPPQPELLSGRIDAYLVAVSQNTAYIDSGDFRCLAVFADERVPSVPEAPTFFELGIETDYQLSFGIWAPKETPQEVVEVLGSSIEQVCKDEEFIKDMYTMGYEVNYLNAEEYKQRMSDSLISIKELSKSVEANKGTDSLIDPYTGAYTVPMFIAGMIILLGIIEVIRKLVKKEKFNIQFIGLFKGRSLIFLIGIWIYALIFDRLGYIISTTLFMLSMVIYLKKHAEEDLNRKIIVKIVISCLGFAVLSYLFFTYVAGIAMPVSIFGI